MIGLDAGRYVLQHDGLSGLGWRNHQASLTHSYRRHQVNNSCGDVFGTTVAPLEDKLLGREFRSQVLKEDFAPGFYVKHFIKDMRIAIESAEEMGLNLPGLKLAKKLYDQLAADGGEDYGTQALFKLYAEDKIL